MAKPLNIKNIIDKFLIKNKKIFDSYKISKETKSTRTYVFISTDRLLLKELFLKELKKLKVPTSQDFIGSSIGRTKIEAKYNTDNIGVHILYKSKSGGMTETTLNSTITELVPCILYTENQKYSSHKNESDINKTMQFLLEYCKKPKQNVYINETDKKAGIRFINSMENSSKYKEKMKNAFGVLKYLETLENIENIYWGYRAKPKGVQPNHKGDLFVEFNTKNILGVSLKAGTSKSEEPKLNTYVKPILEFLDKSAISTLDKKVYNEIHSKIGLPKGWTVKKDLNTIIQWRETNDENILYDKMLNITKEIIIKAFNKDTNKTIDYIKEKIIAVQEDVPLVVVKAFGNDYKMLTEEDDLEAFLPKVIKVNCMPSTRSKQNFVIELKAKKEKLSLNMSIRTNKSLPFNKLAQSWNLAVKFNSLS